MASKMDLIAAPGAHLVRITPPQTNDIPDFAAGKGAYCFVIDVSGSMHAAAQVTTDDGDKVNHGWSQLDIAKHSTNTFISSLGDDDFICVVTYSDGANVLLDWTQTTSDGREKAIAAVHSMRPERSTNLMAGITSGYQQFESFAEKAADALSKYSMQLVITTDGMPSSQWHPARGREGYQPLVNTLAKGLGKKLGDAAKPVVTTIGIGFQLDSELLLKMSHTFLHMPDPGQIGPFIVNLLAACRSVARLPTPADAAANQCTLVVTPAAALRQDICAVAGYEECGLETGYDENGSECVRVDLGSICYDQPRHVVLKTADGGGDFSVALEVGGKQVLTCTSTEAKTADAGQAKLAAVQELRCKAITALSQAASNGTAGLPIEQVAAPIAECVKELKECPYAADQTVKALASTLEKEGLLGAEAANFQKWGAHYFRTLPCMLKSERRSNFRDECLQHFGKDARMREAIFEEMSNMAEMKFATLKPPEPSLLRPQAPVGVPVAGGSQPATAAPPPRPMALPDEFMRGGGCFGPNSTVLVACGLEDDAGGRFGDEGGAEGGGEGSGVRRIGVSEVRAGDRLVCEDGRLAPVRCVVLTECDGGRALLTRVPNGPELTEWHPVRDAAHGGRWRFPHMLGSQVMRSTPYVYNFVLAPGFPTVLVDGVACAALGHGLQETCVAHPYWGTTAVIRDLMDKPGWQAGRVVLPCREGTQRQVAAAAVISAAF